MVLLVGSDHEWAEPLAQTVSAELRSIVASATPAALARVEMPRAPSAEAGEAMAALFAAHTALAAGAGADAYLLLARGDLLPVAPHKLIARRDWGRSFHVGRSELRYMKRHMTVGANQTVSRSASRLSICPSPRLPARLSVQSSVRLSLHLVSLPARLFLYLLSLSTHLFLYMSVDSSLSPFLCPSVLPSVPDNDHDRL